MLSGGGGYLSLKTSSTRVVLWMTPWRTGWDREEEVLDSRASTEGRLLGEEGTQGDSDFSPGYSLQSVVIEDGAEVADHGVQLGAGVAWKLLEPLQGAALVLGNTPLLLLLPLSELTDLEVADVGLSHGH